VAEDEETATARYASPLSFRLVEALADCPFYPKC
jgi:hypothetical protein